MRGLRRRCWEGLREGVIEAGNVREVTYRWRGRERLRKIRAQSDV